MAHIYKYFSIINALFYSNPIWRVRYQKAQSHTFLTLLCVCLAFRESRRISFRKCSSITFLHISWFCIYHLITSYATYQAYYKSVQLIMSIKLNSKYCRNESMILHRFYATLWRVSACADHELTNSACRGLKLKVNSLTNFLINSTNDNRTTWGFSYSVDMSFLLY